MLVFLFVVVGLLFLVSLLPFLYPGSLISLPSSLFNLKLAKSFGVLLPSWGVAVSDGMPVLTLEGVLAIYVPTVAAIYLLMRRG